MLEDWVIYISKPYRVLSQEQPGWRCRGIDPGPGTPEEVAKRIAEEWKREESHFEVSYASGKRTFPELQTIRPKEKETILREKGVYWITGGTGGIGLAIARKLASEKRARLVLTSRNPKLETRVLEELRAAGGEILILPADVTREEEMKQVVQKILSHWGEINGVIHAAGILNDELIRTRSARSAQKVLAPKMEGTDALLSSIQDQKIDFVILCSSLASLFGGVGQSDYAAGNAYLNRKAEEGDRIRSIQWGPWSGVGMAAEEKYQHAFQEQGITPFSPEQGAEVFLKILSTEEKNVAAIQIDPAI